MNDPRHSETPSGAIHTVVGPAMVLPGDDIDTDRIMPARFLRAVTFHGLEAHLFADDRQEARDRGQTHVFDTPIAQHARVLLVGRNFGCGSSREHAPQAIQRWGIRAVVGESFAEIFAGNSVMIGLPCVTVPRSALAAMGSAVTADSDTNVVVDLEKCTVTAGDVAVGLVMPESARHAFISGEWDATALLLADYDEVRRTAGRLPYISGF
jgi:3-isopropylmalate/(R)-2-methylmalate dehydratase small subunit